MLGIAFADLGQRATSRCLRREIGAGKAELTLSRTLNHPKSDLRGSHMILYKSQQCIRRVMEQSTLYKHQWYIKGCSVCKYLQEPGPYCKAPDSDSGHSARVGTFRSRKMTMMYVAYARWQHIPMKFLTAIYATDQMGMTFRLGSLSRSSIAARKPNYSLFVSTGVIDYERRNSLEKVA